MKQLLFSLLTLGVGVASLFLVSVLPVWILLVVHIVLFVVWLFLERERLLPFAYTTLVVFAGGAFLLWRDVVFFHYFELLGLSLWLLLGCVTTLYAVWNLIDFDCDLLVKRFTNLEVITLPVKAKKLLQLKKDTITYGSLLIVVVLLLFGFVKQFALPLLALMLVVLMMRWLVVSMRQRMVLLGAVVAAYIALYLAGMSAVGFGFTDLGPVPLWLAVGLAVIAELMYSLKSVFTK